MANRNFRRPWVPVQDTVIIAGGFRPNGSSAVSVVAPAAGYRGWSVVRTSAGLFTVTIPDQYASVISLVAHLQLTGGLDTQQKYAVVGDVSGVTTGRDGTIQIRTMRQDTAAVSDVTSNANNWVRFIFIFGNSSVNT